MAERPKETAGTFGAEVAHQDLPELRNGNQRDRVATKRRRRFVRRHPWQCGAVAALVGVFVAFVLIYFDPQALFINSTVNEASPVQAVQQGPAVGLSPVTTAPQTLGQGSFRSLEHNTTGTATLLRLPDGSAVLRLENLNTSNGPDVHVTLSPTPADRGASDYGDYLELGPPWW